MAGEAFNAYAAWAASKGLVPMPAPPGQVDAFISEIQAAAGPFAAQAACFDIADAFGAVGLPPPAVCSVGPVAVPAGSDYGRQVPLVGGWGYGSGGSVSLLAGGLSPTLQLQLSQLPAMLSGLVKVNVDQLRAGLVPMPSPGLLSGALRYIRADRTEHWKTLGEVWRDGGGDCEDLAAAVAAERTVLGMPSSVAIIRRPGSRVMHAVVRDDTTRGYLDPSVTGGMGWRE